MDGERTGFKFGVGLGGLEEFFSGGFDKFDEFSVGGSSGDFYAAIFDFSEEFLIDFVAVAVAFDDFKGAVFLRLGGEGGVFRGRVDFGSFRRGIEMSGVVAEAHGATGGFFAFLVLHDVDDVVLFGSAEFFGICGF